MNHLTALLLSFLLPHQSNAAKPASDCTDFHVRQGAFHYQRHSSSDGSCTLMADPFDVGDMVYRSYLVNNQGLLMVFNSYNAGDDATSSGARVFHFFPRKNLPELTEINGESHVQMPAPGIEMVLSQLEAKILRFEGAEFKEDSKVAPSNKGGLEISKVKTLYLDSGFAMGHDVTADANKISTFHDVAGKTCDVRNREVFKYNSDGDSDFKFTDGELKNFLKTRCPRLTVNF